MTHPAEVVEAVARALYSERCTNVKFDAAFPEMQAIYYARAIALLDQIVPQLVAGEREECAEIADNVAADWHHTDDKRGWIADTGRDIAAAIRARGMK